jgi:hypothetical protein
MVDLIDFVLGRLVFHDGAPLMKGKGQEPSSPPCWIESVAPVAGIRQLNPRRLLAQSPLPFTASLPAGGWAAAAFIARRKT